MISSTKLKRRRKNWTISHNLEGFTEEKSISKSYEPSFIYYPVIDSRIPDEVQKSVKGISVLVNFERQKDGTLLGEVVDTVVELIKEDRPEQLRMFTVWLKRMFRAAVKEEKREQITGSTGTKAKLTQLAEKIEERAIHQGLQKSMELKAIENAKKMKEKGYSESEIVGITGLSLEEIRRKNEITT